MATQIVMDHTGIPGIILTRLTGRRSLRPKNAFAN